MAWIDLIQVSPGEGGGIEVIPSRTIDEIVSPAADINSHSDAIAAIIADLALICGTTTQPSQSIAAIISAISGIAGIWQRKGVIDCSGNPNYPAASSGHLYVISVAGKIGGASGIAVEAKDVIICNTDNTVSGTQAAVGAYWDIIQTNIINPESTDNRRSSFQGSPDDTHYPTEKLVKDQLDLKVAVTGFGPLIAGADTKDTILDADLFGFADTAVSNIIKKTTWSNIKAKINAYLVGLFQRVVSASVSDSSGTITCNLDAANAFYCTLSGTGRTLAFSGTPKEGEVYKILLIQGSGGNKTITTYPTVTWMGGGTAPTLSTTAAKGDILTIIYINTVYYADCRLA